MLPGFGEVPLLREGDKQDIAILSYDEKPGMQALVTTVPDLPPLPGKHAGFARDHEYVCHGTLSLLAGIDLVSGKVHALVAERHRSREFIAFLKRIDAAYPTTLEPKQRNPRRVIEFMKT